MRNILLEKNAVEDFEYWGKADIKTLKKLQNCFWQSAETLLPALVSRKR